MPTRVIPKPDGGAERTIRWSRVVSYVLVVLAAAVLSLRPDLFGDPLYLASIGRTALFCAAVTVSAMSVALTLAVFADWAVRGQRAYRTLLIWPYAVAPAVAAVLWILVLHPQVGLAGRWLNAHGVAWDYKLRDAQAMGVVVLASAWKQVSYNFIFFLAGLQSIPRSVVEAARMDGARSWRLFRTVTLPLLMPPGVVGERGACCAKSGALPCCQRGSSGSGAEWTERPSAAS